jgi:flagellar protein FliS
MDAVADHYLVERVATATPAELVGMLYDKAVLSLKRAQHFLGAGEFEKANARIVNASDIVLELRSNLNPAAGELTTRLDALYAWVTHRLLVAGSRRDASAVQEALDVLVPIQTAWRESVVKKSSAPAGVR